MFLNCRKLFCPGAPCAVIATIIALLPCVAFSQVDILTQGDSNTRNSSNRAERILSPSSVTPTGFGKLFTIPLDANVNGQVLYVSHLDVKGKTRNAIFVYTSDNRDGSPSSVFAFDADDGTALWHTSLPNSARFTTAAPVIDLPSKTMFVVTKTENDDGPTFLRAFDLLTGAQTAIIQVQAQARGDGDGSVDDVVYFDGNHGNGTFHANERPGLLLLHGVVYLAFAFNTDRNPYHGWILGYTVNRSGFHQKYVFCTTPNGSSQVTPGGGDGGIWMDGMGLSVGEEGDIYCSIGNGTFDANTGGTDYGMCFLRLTPQLKPVDYFSPHDEAAKSAADLDTGDTGVIPLPDTHELFAGATKFGDGFLMSIINMGKFSANASDGHDGIDGVTLRLNGLSSNYNIGQNPMCWQSGTLDNIFLWPRNSQVEQMVYNVKSGAFTPAAKSSNNPATNRPYPREVTYLSTGMTSGGELGVSSLGDENGILWAVGYDNVVYALNPSDVSDAPYWTSAMNSARDSLPSVGHFQFPTIANGKVYVPTGSASINVYGLLKGARG